MKTLKQKQKRTLSPKAFRLLLRKLPAGTAVVLSLDTPHVRRQASYSSSRQVVNAPGVLWCVQSFLSPPMLPSEWYDACGLRLPAFCFPHPHLITLDHSVLGVGRRGHPGPSGLLLYPCRKHAVDELGACVVPSHTASMSAATAAAMVDRRKTASSSVKNWVLISPAAHLLMFARTRQVCPVWWGCCSCATPVCDFFAEGLCCMCPRIARGRAQVIYSRCLALGRQRPEQQNLYRQEE